MKTSYVLESIKSWHIYHFHDTSDNAGLKQIAKLMIIADYALTQQILLLICIYFSKNTIKNIRILQGLFV